MFQFGWHNADYPQDIGKRVGQLLDLCGLTVEKHEVTVFPRPEGVPEEAESITHIYILSQSHPHSPTPKMTTCTSSTCIIAGSTATPRSSCVRRLSLPFSSCSPRVTRVSTSAPCSGTCSSPA